MATTYIDDATLHSSAHRPTRSSSGMTPASSSRRGTHAGGAEPWAVRVGPGPYPFRWKEAAGHDAA